MKITTSNIKHPLYCENHEIYIGTHTGSFKQINVGNADPYKQKNIQNIKNLTKTSKVTSLCWGNENEILIGRANKFVKVYDCNSSDFTSNINMIDGPIVGLARYDNQLIAGIESGKIQILKDTPNVLETGDHLSRMRQCKFDKKLIATGGKGRQNNLKVWDLETETRIFSSKNMPNDYLQLEIPVWDSDMSFIDNKDTLATCSRYGYIRLYDTREQRRPILCFEDKAKEEMTYTCLASHGNMIYVGAATGIARAFDSRKLKTIVHTYKGFTGTISDLCLDDTGKYLFAACFDRFVRVFCSESTVLQYQCYVKSKATQILVRNGVPLDNDCLFLGQLSSDEEAEDSTAKPNDATVNNDPEFDELFNSMPKVEDETDVKPKTTKRKPSNTRNKPSLKKKK